MTEEKLCLYITRAVLLLAGLLYVPEEVRVMRRVSEAVARAEEYKKEHGRYPKNLRVAGMTEREEDPVQYVREEDGEYCLYRERGFESELLHCSRRPDIR